RDEAGHPTFVDLSDAYDGPLADRAVSAAREVGIAVSRGVYAAVAGPSFETRAETEVYREAGATVVGMSVVPEVAAARALGMRVLGIWCVTNRVGAGVTHEEVLRVAGAAAEPLGRVLERVVAEA
ncbi:MAG TPA: purine-nucleoside phosphorylase, partial [Actinomycetota bacterium]|nr:purine-nucleoside phosphorylase [Actinomycetota bacterium]